MVKAFFDQKYADLQNRIIISETLEESYRKRGAMLSAHAEYKKQQRLKKELHALVMEYAELSEIKAEGTI